MKKHSISLIFLAGGQGTRINKQEPKQFALIGKKTLALHSFDTISTLSAIEESIVVCKTPYQSIFPKTVKFALPGDSRQHSTFNGLKKVSDRCDFVLIHDAARPFIQKEDVIRLIEEGVPSGASALGVPVQSTIKELNDNQTVRQTLNRSNLFEIQTPQLVRKSILEKGFEKAFQQNLTLTDDTSFAELIGHSVKIVTGSYGNFKITTPFDLKLAKALCKNTE